MRTYAGADQRDAVRRFAIDAAAMTGSGYRVASYAWEPGRRSAPAALQPGLLAARHGTLTVTYESGPAQPSRDLEAAVTVAPPGVAAELIDLLSARAEGVISDERFVAMRRRLVPRS